MEWATSPVSSNYNMIFRRIFSNLKSSKRFEQLAEDHSWLILKREYMFMEKESINCNYSCFFTILDRINFSWINKVIYYEMNIKNELMMKVIYYLRMRMFGSILCKMNTFLLQQSKLLLYLQCIRIFGMK